MGSRGEDQQGAAPSGTGLVGGGPGQDVPGALTERFLLTGAPSPAPAAPAAAPTSPATPSPWEQPPSRQSPDFCASDSPIPTEVVDEGGVRVASAAMAEQEAEARAALAAEGLEAAQVPVSEEEGSGMASGGSAGSLGWFGVPDPDPGSLDTSDRLPMSPDKRSPGPGTPEEVYKGVKQEPREGE